MSLNVASSSSSKTVGPERIPLKTLNTSHRSYSNSSRNQTPSTLSPNDGAPSNVSKSTSAHITLNSSAESSQNGTTSSNTSDNLPESWHPKLTAYRILALGSMVGFATAKAVASYRDKSIASTTIEWIAGVLIFILTWALGEWEQYRLESGSTSQAWLFDVDYSSYFWKLLSFLRLPVPKYRSEESIAVPLIKPVRPVMTAYRFIITTTTIIFGMGKATLSYYGLSTAPTTAEWIIVAFWGSGVFWLGLYEYSAGSAYPDMFEGECTGLMGMCQELVVHALIAGGFAYWIGAFYTIFVDIFNRGNDEPLPPHSHIFNVFTMFSTVYLAFLVIGVIVMLTGFAAAMWAKSLVTFLYPFLHAIATKFRKKDTSSSEGLPLLSDRIEDDSPGFTEYFSKIVAYSLLLFGHGIFFYICWGWFVTWAFLGVIIVGYKDSDPDPEKAVALGAFGKTLFVLFFTPLSLIGPIFHVRTMDSMLDS